MPAAYPPEKLLMIPEHVRDPLRDYLDKGQWPGSALGALLSNDLRTAVTLLDDRALAGMKSIVLFLINYAPPMSFGDYATVTNWQRRGGLSGRFEVL